MLYNDNLKSIQKTANFSINNIDVLKRNLNTQKIKAITPSSIKIGGLYFIEYDIAKINKSSKAEQVLPCLIVDYNKSFKNVLWVLNFNLMPQELKIMFFKDLFSSYNDILEYNTKIKNVLDEKVLSNISYNYMFDKLLSYGINYCIREIRIELINNIFQVSTDFAHVLTTLNTQFITGIDEKKLIEIWSVKMQNNTLENRLDDKKIYADYEKIINELKNKFKNLE